MKKVIRLNETNFHKLVNKSVKRVLKEFFANSYDPYNAETLEDFDEMMKSRRDGQREAGERAMNYHPQRDSRIDAHNYAVADPIEYGNDLSQYRRHMDAFHGPVMP